MKRHIGYCGISNEDFEHESNVAHSIAARYYGTTVAISNMHGHKEIIEALRVKRYMLTQAIPLNNIVFNECLNACSGGERFVLLLSIAIRMQVVTTLDRNNIPISVDDLFSLMSGYKTLHIGKNILHSSMDRRMEDVLSVFGITDE